MRKLTLQTILLALLITLLASGQRLLAQEEAIVIEEPSSALEREQTFMDAITSQWDEPEGDSSDTKAFLRAIDTIESSQGAYAARLPEQMLSFGLSLQREKRHSEAVEVFKRGVHLARVNNGLYSAEQIPLLQGEIASLLALGNYSQADDRQHYLYRVQVRSLGSGPQRADALLQQADWQYRAYRQGLGWQGFSRLSNMWNLYRLALNDIISAEGKTSPRLLGPLHGMLRTQYLISSFQGETGEIGLSFGSGISSQLDANQFSSYRANSYTMGQSVIMAIYDIQKSQHGQDSIEAGNALVMMGDWALWHGKRDEASEVYTNAIAELAAPDDAQSSIGQMFAEPVPLPDLDGIRPLPPAVSPEQGNILLEFGVNHRGRVIDLVRLDENVDHDGIAIRLMRELRKTRFRPRYQAGQAVEADKLVRAYNIE